MDAIKKPAHYNQGPIECIDAMKIVLTPEEFRGYLKGNVFKYLWREKDKNGIEDLRKGKDYLDRLIELFDESETEQPVIKQSLTTDPPDGWRWLNKDEVIRKGDAYWLDGDWWDYDNSIGTKVVDTIWPSIRRNKFEVGEKVVHVDDKEPVVYVVDKLRGDGAVIAYRENGTGYSISPKLLAPYIEEQS